MSVFQTLKQQNANVIKTTVNALHHFLKTKKLPSLAQAIKNSANSYEKTYRKNCEESDSVS